MKVWISRTANLKIYRNVSSYSYNVWKDSTNILSLWLTLDNTMDADVADIFLASDGMLILSAEL